MNESALHYLPFILSGIVNTIKVTAGGALVALVVAFVFGLARLSSSAVIRGVAALYIEFFRGTSVFVQLFWVYFVLPVFGLSLSPLIAGIVVLGMNVGAYASEVVRGAILAVPVEQREACVALNLTTWQRMRHVISPQALLIMLPTLGNNSIELRKGSSIVSIISFPELTFYAQVVRTQTGNTTIPFITILIIYFIMSITISKIFRLIESRMSRYLHVKFG
mgnify:CR=1 FL=1